MQGQNAIRQIVKSKTEISHSVGIETWKNEIEWNEKMEIGKN